jgi:hypothetical protein
MSRLIGPIRVRLLILASLVIFTVFAAMPQQAASACITCVALTGGLCVGCDPNVSSGFNACWPTQEDCSCWVQGSCHILD